MRTHGIVEEEKTKSPKKNESKGKVVCKRFFDKLIPKFDNFVRKYLANTVIENSSTVKVSNIMLKLNMVCQM